jgi:pantoate--beta-alanine ligase
MTPADSVTVFRHAEEIHRWTRKLAQSNQTLALVPTMGFLHQGHVSLMIEGRRRADVLATSIFVNPTQFGPTEDLSRYPRDFDGDLAKCAQAGCSVVFAPEQASMYPPGTETSVVVEHLSQGLCGDRRPGHFRGVATVVTKLLALFRPHVALFGEKDFQQLQVIRALNRDLNLGVDIVGMPIVREPDGLAMSSRNTYLSTDERHRALAIVNSLRQAQQSVRNGETSVSVLITQCRQALARADLREDYIEIRDADTLTPLETLASKNNARLFIACFAGKTRLIDNVSLA